MSASFLLLKAERESPEKAISISPDAAAVVKTPEYWTMRPVE
jgi:hypothetical protein